MSFENTAALAIAVSDLKVVQLLRDAINSGLPKTGPLGTIPPGANPATPRPHLKFGGSPQSDRNVSPQRGLHASPRFEPRPVVHPQPYVADRPAIYGPPTAPVGETPKRVSPFPPIWATLPPVECDSVPPVIKVYPQKVDLITKGTLLDLFV